ncbi:MAG: methylenetetrahydrofolate reductase [Campylobacteraceae bacterium]|jgi:5,10-methylenetetrahydrofolate reductase|nr:methylenetetrahydrofolate reductase [Campylobacteraceae bacterium]MBT3881823.1 methylenetetrahydrofolate reductase [Campylobacteraceae bacterium]MBT4030363.1 methylenetetrahydrofolate reductase [Campylobacteraceae bacterium]MBT4179670.1 methylenetetrahydrofolate reductase [Campylobacteraceae bacterium]MBT4707183.1 methylenetetrahydrofolate reductase [Campylobacteraceae bacterium]
MFNELLNKLQTDSYLTLETTPTHEPTLEKIVSEIEKYDLANKVDGFSTTDNPLAKLKYNALFAALKLQTQFKKPVIATMSMRDRNKIALQSDLLGANDFDIRAILALTGDPAKMSDQPHTKGVFESNSIMLLEMIYSFNNGMDYAGKPFKTEPKTISPFAVINSYAKNFKTLEKKMYKKIQHGAVGLITQPVYDIENVKVLLSHFENTKGGFKDERELAQLVFGIFPITKLRTAQFLSSHVPGIHVPQDWIEALSKAAKTGTDEEYKVGMDLSKKLFEDLKKLHPKIHMMTANKFDIASEIII